MRTLQVDGVGADCPDFVTELVEEALAEAVQHPDGFTPFGAVLEMDGSQWRIREHENLDPQAVLDEIRSALGQEGGSARCVALVWDGYADLLDGAYEAVNVEVYELGRPDGRLIGLAYRRDPQGVTPVRQLAEQPLTDPVVPLTADLVRRHLDEWVEDGRADLRLFVQQLDADTYGYDDLEDDLRDFDEDPRTSGPLLDEWLADFPFGELDHDDAVALLAPVARLIGEALVTVHGGRWDVTVENGQIGHIVVVGGNDGESHAADTYGLVAEYADAPLPPVSAIIERAENQVHR